MPIFISSFTSPMHTPECLVSFTIKIARNLLKIGKSTAYELVRKKELAAFKLHGIWKITEEALYDFINKSGQS